MADQHMYYNHYLQLDKLLDAQHPESFKEGNEPAHDEMLFIIIHQAYELWFRQILFELDFVMGVFSKQKIDDNSGDLNLVKHRLNRNIEIFKLLNQQITLLDTMTPLDFLEFRNLLIPASGFQSMQFRLIEARLGLKMQNRHGEEYYKRTNEGGFQEEEYKKINATEDHITLIQQINRWLERLPFFENEYWQNYLPRYPAIGGMHPFWSDYLQTYQSGLSEKEANKIIDFNFVFFEKSNSDLAESTSPEEADFSAKAMRAGLFIMLYRDFPVFQTSYGILNSLVETDHQMATWRHKHLVMVRRMIGLRVGTGNTSGRGYLEGALNKHYIFKDIAGISTFLIQRKELPKLPEALIRKLSYST